MYPVGNNGLPPRTVDILGIPVTALKRQELTQRFSDLLRSNVRGCVSNANIHAMNLAEEYPWFKQFQQKALLVFCDGEGVRLGARLLGHHIPERITLTDWIYDVCNTAANHGVGIFLLGGREGVAAAAASRLVASVPSLIVAGSHHGYFTQDESQSIVSLINNSRAGVLIVGMGMPKQEQWIQSNYSHLEVSLVLNGGSVLDYVAGVRKRCPGWMGHVGLEWAYRLFQEPGRLWKRYLLGNPRFIIRVLLSRLNA